MHNLFRAVITLFVFFLAVTVISLIVGENPLLIAQQLILGGFSSQYDLGKTLYYTTPLIFTGLAVALPLKAGLFNIGAEGQLYVGAFGGFFIAQCFPQTPDLIALPLACFACFAFGAFWGGFAGWIRAFRGGHEVVATIMMNYIATAITSYLTLNHFRSHETQSPETFSVTDNFKLPNWQWFEGASVNHTLALSILLCLALWLWERHTIGGFRLRAVGENPTAARVNRINVPLIQCLCFCIAGGLAGLVGYAEVFGNSHRFQVGFSIQYGFMGIAVALVARKHFLLIPLVALLFGAMNQGASLLQFRSEKIIPEVVLILQALLIILMATLQLSKMNFRKNK